MAHLLISRRELDSKGVFQVGLLEENTKKRALIKQNFMSHIKKSALHTFALAAIKSFHFQPTTSLRGALDGPQLKKVINSSGDMEQKRGVKDYQMRSSLVLSSEYRLELAPLRR